MPTKKKSTVTMPRVKMIDTTSENVSPAVRKMVHGIETTFRNQVATCNIPVFKVMQRTLTLESYFMNHDDYMAILGDNVELLDRMMFTAIANGITSDILNAIEHGKVNYVGVWDHDAIYSIASASITFMKNDKDPMVRYLTPLQFAVISDEDLAKQAEGSYMKFSDYNPNRFAEQVLMIRGLVVKCMTDIIQNRIPMAFLSSGEDNLASRLQNYYVQYLKEALGEIMPDAIEDVTEEDKVYWKVNEVKVAEYLDSTATEKKVRTFIDAFEQPFLTMMTMLLHESGLSSNLINMELGTSKIHILYDDPADKKMKDLRLDYAMVFEGFENDKRPLQIGYEINVGDAVQVAMELSTVSRTRKENFGKGIRSFLLEMVTYAINIYTRTISANKAANAETEEITSGYIAPADAELEEIPSTTTVSSDVDEVLK